MSALQLRALLAHILDDRIHSLKFAYRGGRLFMIFVAEDGETVHRSYGTDGDFTDEDVFEITVGA